MDGNKRLAWTACDVSLRTNGVVVDIPEDDAYDLVIAVAERHLRLQEIARCLIGPTPSSTS